MEFVLPVGHGISIYFIFYFIMLKLQNHLKAATYLSCRRYSDRTERPHTNEVNAVNEAELKQCGSGGAVKNITLK